MKSSLVLEIRSSSMFFNRKKDKEYDRKEAQIQAIRQDTLKKIDKAQVSTSKVNELLKEDLGITGMIFYATGGDKRQ
jgi:hypothetical protein